MNEDWRADTRKSGASGRWETKVFCHLEKRIMKDCS